MSLRVELVGRIRNGADPAGGCARGVIVPGVERCSGGACRAAAGIWSGGSRGEADLCNCTAQWNCSASVEPTSASVPLSGLMAVDTLSK